MAAMRFLQRWRIPERPGIGATIIGVVAAVAIPTLVRLAVDPVLGDATAFATYYPADLLVALFLGWPAATTTLVLSLVVGNLLFMEPRFAFSLAVRDSAAMSLYLSGGGVIVLTGALLRSAIGKLEAARVREAALKLEMQHRLKNTLAVVQAIARTTALRGGDVKAFHETLDSRMAALAEAQDVLSESRFEACAAPELLERALRPFAAADRIAIDDRPAQLAPASGVPLSLALHELATNALKHGSLSVPEGRVSVTWRLETPDARHLVLRWQESGGPPVRRPSRRGLGSRLLVRQTGLDEVDLRFEPAGVTCEIRVPLARAPADRSADLGLRWVPAIFGRRAQGPAGGSRLKLAGGGYNDTHRSLL